MSSGKIFMRFAVSFIVFISLAIPFSIAMAHGDHRRVIKSADIPKLLRSLEGLREKEYCGKKPQIFDVHLHYHKPADKEIKPEQILEILNKMGVRKALLSSVPNENSHKLYDLAPNRFFLGLMPYKKVEHVNDWMDFPALIKMVQNFIESKKYPYVAVGEFHLKHNMDLKNENVSGLVELAAEHDLFLHAHTSATGIKGLFKMNPKIQIHWAHAGAYNIDPDPRPSTIGKLMDAYPNLWTEVSFNEHVAPNGKLSPPWKELFLRHHSRVMVGTDPFDVERWEEFPKVIDELRTWLCQLPENVSEDLAWKSAERLIERKK